jgi:YgiT-type zinc finger domain-containing protein
MKTQDAEAVQDLIPCFECTGTLRAVIIPYLTQLPGLGEVTVEDVPMLRCPDCGDTVIGHQGSDRIDSCLNEIRRAHDLALPKSGPANSSLGGRGWHE